MSESERHADDVAVVQRRAPFADNPLVGVRGARTQQRILEAALLVFGDVGYHACRVERITAVAGCSRPSFYQYFRSKEDVFRQLAGQLARSLTQLTDELAPITPDSLGRQRLRAFLGHYGDLYDKYAALFAAFSSAAGSDDVVATGAARVGSRLTAGLDARFPSRTAPSVQQGLMAPVLLNTISRANRYRQLLTGTALGPDVAFERPRLDEALTDVVHRTLCGPLRRINVGPRVGPRKKLRRLAGDGAGLADVDGISDGGSGDGDGLGPIGRATRLRLLAAGAEIFAEHGYHAARVDDIVIAAGVSHGTFYRYFENKEEVFRVVVAVAGRQVVEAIDAMPRGPARVRESPAEPAIRRWLDRYAATYAAAGPIIRVWIEALSLAPALRDQSAEVVERVRQRLARFLAGRAFGDVDADSLVLLALLDLGEYAVVPEPAGVGALDAVEAILQRGILGAGFPG